jgi:hypothetical protein
MMPFMMAGAFLTPHTIADSTTSARSVFSLLLPPPDGDSATMADGTDGAVDLFGNDVTDAVARYTFDQDGSLYELHSPQTELPRLAPPRS